MKRKFGHIILALFLSSIAWADIPKSPEDDKQYRYLVLDNAMKVLLVSDPSADKAGASLDVNIGSGSDPDDWPGLAHFLEHMLFLGTRKYPEPGEYQTYINTHGGTSNAYTSYAHTNYFFSVGTEYLEPALDRFSQFFLEPLFNPDLVDSERSIIQSEYLSLKKDEFRRLWDVQKKWLNPEHPSARFTVGTLETLRDREGLSARDKMLWFHEKYYSANLMALAVVGRDSLDQLEELVIEKFADINNNGVELPRHEQSYFNRDLMPARIDAIPEKDVYSLSFSFPVPSTYTEYQSNPLGYISHLLGHEGPGSLFDALKQKGWIESLKAGPEFMDRVQGSFSVSMNLTQKGLGEIGSIGEFLFKKINLIREEGIEEWRYDEQTRLGQIAFRYAQEIDQGRLAQSLSSRLQRYPHEDVLSGPYFMEQYDPERIHELLGYLTPQNVNMRVVGPDLETDQVSEHYDVQYRLSPIDNKMIQRWSDVEHDPLLAVPGPNRFIPTRLERLENQDASPIPIRLDNQHGIDLWHQYDAEFGDPRANLYITFLSPVPNQSPRDRIMTELYVQLVIDQLSDIVYDAYLAGISHELFSHYRGVTLKISGFEGPQSDLLKVILDALMNPDLGQQKLEIVRQSVERSLKNVFRDTPANQSIHELYRILMVPYWTENERLDALKGINKESMQDFLKRFYQDMQVVMLSHGDVSPDSSLQNAQMVAGLISEHQPKADTPRLELRTLDRGKPWLRSVEIDHSDASLSVYFQSFNSSLDERAKMTLLARILRPRFYNRIRTVNEVGYLVFSGSLDIERTPGLFFASQSSTYPPAEMLDLYDEFLKSTRIYLENMSMDEFKDIKVGLIARILRKPLKLSDRTSRLWREIDLKELDFDTREKLAGRINELTLEEIQVFYETRVLNNSARLIVQSAGAKLQGSISGDFVPIDSAESLNRKLR
ncbi:MAG: hypothetical protein F4X92_10000 [Gammaproteobacteria bacterium]|nr:hypothetical protein [Gammaproteobacteria bacterium]